MDGSAASYAIPLLDRLVVEDPGDPVADRDEAMKTLREYAEWTGILNPSEFVQDQFDMLDGKNVVQKSAPGSTFDT